jgi:hypothetical protein
MLKDDALQAGLVLSDVQKERMVSEKTSPA